MNLPIADVPPALAPSAQAWPPACTLAELGRILTMMHGAHAPSESLLKRWNANGVFQDCALTAANESDRSFTQRALARPQRAGRPGLRLDTGLAIQKVREQWPQLAQSDTQAILELAVARTADRLQSTLAQWIPANPRADPGALPATLEKIEERLAALQDEMARVKRELAQFSALRNNLITRLDEAVARTQEALSTHAPSAGLDPLGEARRERDMGLLKSMMGDVLETLARIEGAPR
jgi:DNA-binding transcriptional MerR regulator